MLLKCDLACIMLSSSGHHTHPHVFGLQGLTKEIALSQRGYLGYIGPLNAACLKAGKKPVFDGIAAASMVEEKSAVRYRNAHSPASGTNTIAFACDCWALMHAAYDKHNQGMFHHVASA